MQSVSGRRLELGKMQVEVTRRWVLRMDKESHRSDRVRSRDDSADGVDDQRSTYLRSQFVWAADPQSKSDLSHGAFRASDSWACWRFLISMMRVTRWTGMGWSAGNRMVPLPTAYGFSSSPSSSTISSFHGNRL